MQCAVAISNTECIPTSFRRNVFDKNEKAPHFSCSVFYETPVRDGCGTAGRAAASVTCHASVSSQEQTVLGARHPPQDEQWKCDAAPYRFLKSGGGVRGQRTRSLFSCRRPGGCESRLPRPSRAHASLSLRAILQANGYKRPSVDLFGVRYDWRGWEETLSQNVLEVMTEKKKVHKINCLAICYMLHATLSETKPQVVLRFRQPKNGFFIFAVIFHKIGLISLLGGVNMFQIPIHRNISSLSGLQWSRPSSFPSRKINYNLVVSNNT